MKYTRNATPSEPRKLLYSLMTPAQLERFQKAYKTVATTK